jgi:hypothetical protein
MLDVGTAHTIDSGDKNCDLVGSKPLRQQRLKHTSLGSWIRFGFVICDFGFEI